MTDIPFAPAAERNRQPILDVLQNHLPAEGTVLEVASGTGQHVRYFAEHLPGLIWQPSERDAAAVEILRRGLSAGRCDNVLPERVLDVAGAWPEAVHDAVITANLLHVSPPEITTALCVGAARVCRASGVLHIYGPFKQAGQHTSPGNAAFDASLKQRDERLGLRDAEWVITEAQTAGFTLRAQVDMPANNLSLVFERRD